MTKTLRVREVLTKDEARTLLEQKIAEAGGVRGLARAHLLTPGVISQARKPDSSIPPSICELLGLEKNEETYTRK